MLNCVEIIFYKIHSQITNQIDKSYPIKSLERQLVVKNRKLKVRDTSRISTSNWLFRQFNLSLQDFHSDEMKFTALY